MDNNGLIDWRNRLYNQWEQIEYSPAYLYTQLENLVANLLAEQKQKTREDTLNNIEAIWTRLMNETDDPVKKEVYANCIRALKI